MKKKYLKVMYSTLIVGAFLVLAFGSDESKSSSSSSSNSSSPTKTEEKKCERCGGRGRIATYGAYGCSDMSHFASYDCGTDSHTSSCTSSGSKTCPCCNGTGK